MATETKKNELADSVGTVIADAASELANQEGNDEELDAKAELFARRITDGVVKAVANLLKPPVADDKVPDDEEEIPDAKDPTKKVRRKKRTAPVEKQRKTVWQQLGLK
jgi:hypothetical protein